MVYIILCMLYAVSGFLLGFGDSGRGKYSQYISVSAGIIWVCAIALGFFQLGVAYGALMLPISFLICAITMNIGKKVVLKLRGK